MCFPGGMVDSDDSTIVHTSLREMEEELGIVSECLPLLNFLINYVSHSLKKLPMCSEYAL